VPIVSSEIREYETGMRENVTHCKLLIRDLPKRRGRIVSAPASYSVGPGFKYRPGECILTDSFRGFPQSLQANAWKERQVNAKTA
jgi:hypothetical protein